MKELDEIAGAIVDAAMKMRCVRGLATPVHTVAVIVPTTHL